MYTASLANILPKSNGRPLPASLPKSPHFTQKRCTPCWMPADHLPGIILWYRRMIEGMSAAMYPEALEERRKGRRSLYKYLPRMDGEEWAGDGRTRTRAAHPEYRLLVHLPINLTTHVSHGSPMYVNGWDKNCSCALAVDIYGNIHYKHGCADPLPFEFC